MQNLENLKQRELYIYIENKDESSIPKLFSQYGQNDYYSLHVPAERVRMIMALLKLQAIICRIRCTNRYIFFLHYNARMQSCSN